MTSALPAPRPGLRLNPSMPAPRPSSLPAPACSTLRRCRSPKPGGQCWGVPPPQPLRGVPAGGAVASLGCLTRDPGAHWRSLSPERSHWVQFGRQRSRGSAARSLPQFRSRAGAHLPVVPPGVRRLGVECPQSDWEWAGTLEPDPGLGRRDPRPELPRPGSRSARPPSASCRHPPAVSAPSEPRARPWD